MTCCHKLIIIECAMGGICGRKIKYEIQFEDELYGVDPEYYVIGIVAPREIQKKMMKHIAKRGYNCE